MPDNINRPPWGGIAPKPDTLLEPHFADAYNDYAQTQSPESASRLLQAVNPVIDEGLRSYAGGELNSPVARAKAKKLTLEAVRRYDPTRAKLRTHLLSHLRGLRRQVERSTAAVYVPEQWRLDAQRIDTSAQDFKDELGREPSDAEFSARLGIPIDRVRKARASPGAVSMSQAGGSMEGTKKEDKEAWDKWLESIYVDVGPVDQVIMEHSLGLHGKEQKPANQIAKMVNLSPGAISQRAQRLQKMIDEFDSFMGRA